MCATAVQMFYDAQHPLGSEIGIVPSEPRETLPRQLRTRTLGYFVAFDFTADAEREVRKFLQRQGREIRLLKVAELIEMDHERIVAKKPPASVRPVQQGELAFPAQKTAGLMPRAKR